MHTVKWTERKFLFGYDSGYAPLFMERLRCTAPRIEELLYKCDDASAGERKNNSWSLKEHIGHLTDLEKLHDGRLDDYINGLDTLRPADMTNKATEEATHNQKTINQLISDFRAVRGQYLKRLESMDEHIFNAVALHPRLQQMITLTDLLHFEAEHDTHHLTKMAEILTG